MSATGRSEVRRTNDVYITPDWCIKRFVERYTLPSGLCLDPCAARGELLSVIKAVRPDIKPLGIELRSECREDLMKVTGAGDGTTGDFLELDLRGAFYPKEDARASIKSIVTNPPYSLAEQFIRVGLKIVPIVAMLLRINFIRGDGRHRLMELTKPGIFVLPERPSFTGRGTDATEYAWFVWGDAAVSGKWFMLAETSDEERAAWNKHARILHPVDTTPTQEIS